MNLTRDPVASRFALRGALIASALLGVTLLIVSLAGLVFGTRGLYADDPATAPAFLGQDGITLGVGLPLLFISMGLATRRSLVGFVLWMASLFYFAYSYAFYVLDPRVTPLFPAYALVVALSTYTLASLLVGPASQVAREHGPFAVPRKTASLYLVGMGALFVALWTAMFVGTFARGEEPSTVQHIVWSLDFMFALPGMFVAGVLLWRRSAWGALFGGVMLVKATFLGFTLLLTTFIARFWGVVPDVGQTAMFAVLGVAGLAITVRFLGGLRRAPHTHSAPPR